MKKDKNSSNGIGYVLNAQTGNAAGDKVSTDKQKKQFLIFIHLSLQGTFKLNVAKVDDEADGEDVLYINQLLDLVLTRMNDKYKNQTEVFRFIDAKGKGKVKKTDFVAAVEKMRISLSREDINKVFAKIDSNKVGYFTF